MAFAPCPYPLVSLIVGSLRSFVVSGIYLSFLYSVLFFFSFFISWISASFFSSIHYVVHTPFAFFFSTIHCLLNSPFTSRLLAFQDLVFLWFFPPLCNPGFLSAHSPFGLCSLFLILSSFSLPLLYLHYSPAPSRTASV